MNKNSIVRIAAALVLMFLAIGSAAPVQADFPTPAVPGWKLAWLDHQRNFSNLSQQAMAFDAANHPHIAYGGGGLYHAWHNGSFFQVEDVDPSVNVGQHASIAIGPASHIHIAYYDAGQGDLKYATNISGAWTTQTVVSSGDVGVETAIFVDTDDVPYIVYKDKTNQKLMFIAGTMNFPMVWESPEVASGNAPYVYDFSMVMRNNLEVFLSFGVITAAEDTQLWYAHRTALGQWSTTIIDSGSLSDFKGHHSAIDLDNHGYPWIAYSDNNHTFDLYLVRVAHWTGTSWHISGAEEVFYANTGGLDIVINKTSNDLYMVYQDESSSLSYTEWNGSSWINDWSIEIEVGSDNAPSIALDSAGLPGVSYFDGATSELHYREKVNSTTWSGVYYVDVTLNSGDCPVVRLDKQDNPHVLYYDQFYKTLRYNEFVNNHWTGKWTIDTVGDGALLCQSGLALTTAGLPRVAFANYHNLYYAYGGIPLTGFTQQLIDTDPGGWFELVTMVLDSDSYPHIVYTKRDLLYHAFDDGTGWQIEAIRDKPTQTQLISLYAQPSLAIDANDNLYLAFATYSGLDFITRTTGPGGGWQTVQHVSTAVPWNGISLVLRPPLNLPQIAAAYLSDHGGPEWVGLSSYICFGGCIWSTAVINTAVPNDTFDNFLSPSLATDRNGALTLTYYDNDAALPNGLVVARRTGSNWVSQHIDDQKGAGYRNWLALTASGKARIAYYDAVSQDLRFAWELDRVFIPKVRK